MLDPYNLKIENGYRNNTFTAESEPVALIQEGDRVVAAIFAPDKTWATAREIAQQFIDSLEALAEKTNFNERAERLLHDV